MNFGSILLVLVLYLLARGFAGASKRFKETASSQRPPSADSKQPASPPKRPKQKQAASANAGKAMDGGKPADGFSYQGSRRVERSRPTDSMGQGIAMEDRSWAEQEPISASRGAVSTRAGNADAFGEHPLINFGRSDLVRSFAFLEVIGRPKGRRRV